MPGDLAGSDDAFAEEQDLVGFPGNFGQQGGEGLIGLCRGEKGVMISQGAVLREEVGWHERSGDQ